MPTCIARPCELGMHERFWKGPVSYETRTSPTARGLSGKKARLGGKMAGTWHARECPPQTGYRHKKTCWKISMPSNI